MRYRYICIYILCVCVYVYACVSVYIYMYIYITVFSYFSLLHQQLVGVGDVAEILHAADRFVLFILTLC